MTFDSEDKLCFLVCWEDKQSGLLRNFHLYFYPGSNSVEMFDIKTRKVFLKKTQSDRISRGDLYIGNTIVLYARSLKIMDYGDEVTRETCSSTENTLALVKPGSVVEVGQIMTRVRLEGMRVARVKMVELTRHQAEHFYRKYRLEPLFEELVTDLMSDVSVVMELVGRNVLQAWLSVIALEGTSLQEEDVSQVHRKSVYGSASQQEAEDDINYFFPSSRLLSSSLATPSTRHLAGVEHTSCCVIRPHAFSRAGDIIHEIISAGFQIAAMENFLLDFGKADEFLEVYKGVIDHYGEAVKELSSGDCIALQIVLPEDPENVVARFRELCGPQDPAVAKSLRPKSLRGKFGETLTKNGVHCTDLREDGPLEVEYFFNVLQ